jgi:hypothetical protein
MPSGHGNTNSWSSRDEIENVKRQGVRKCCWYVVNKQHLNKLHSTHRCWTVKTRFAILIRRHVIRTTQPSMDITKAEQDGNLSNNSTIYHAILVAHKSQTACFSSQPRLDDTRGKLLGVEGRKRLLLLKVFKETFIRRERDNCGNVYRRR